MRAPRWPLILWGLLSLLRPHLCAEKCHFLVNDISDDGHLYVDGVNPTISFRLSDSCAGDEEPVWVDLGRSNRREWHCEYRRDGEQYVSQAGYRRERCGYDAGTGVFSVRASTEDVNIQTEVYLSAGDRPKKLFVKRFPVTAKELSQIINFTLEINGTVITANDSNILWVEENSTVTLGCEWSPGKPPQTAVLNRNQIALHPVKSSDMLLEVKHVEHTIVRFGGHDSGVYTCQLGATENTTIKHLQLSAPPWFDISNQLTFRSSAVGRVDLHFHVLTHSTHINDCWIERIPAGDLPFTDKHCDSASRGLIVGSPPNCRLHATFHGTSANPSGNFTLYLDTGGGQGHVTFSVIASPEAEWRGMNLFLLLGGLGGVVLLVIVVGSVVGIFMKRRAQRGERGDPGMGNRRLSTYAVLYGVTRQNRSHELSAETEDPNRSHSSSTETENMYTETDDACVEFGTTGDPESRPSSNNPSSPPPCRGRRRMPAEEKRPPLMKTDAPCTVHTHAAGTALPSDYLHPTFDTQAAGTALPSDYLHLTFH